MQSAAEKLTWFERGSVAKQTGIDEIFKILIEHNTPKHNKFCSLFICCIYKFR